MRNLHDKPVLMQLKSGKVWKSQKSLEKSRFTDVLRILEQGRKSERVKELRLEDGDLDLNQEPGTRAKG